MIIQNPNVLNEWLINVLEPICDADPQALAKYIMALIKKDKTQDELKKICLEQLEVFLQNETNSFVDILFENLNNKSYLNSNHSKDNKDIHQSRSPKLLNIPAPSGSSRRHYQNHQPQHYKQQQYQPQQHQDLSSRSPNHNNQNLSPVDRKRRSRSKSSGKTYKRNRSRSPTQNQQENHYTDSNSGVHKRRCRDYDEKGYCLRGNLCTYDHGVNPLILDSLNSNSVVISGINPPANKAANSILLTSNNQQQQYTPNSLITEPYNPEEPAINTSEFNHQYLPTVNNDNRNVLNQNNVYLPSNDYSNQRFNNNDDQSNQPQQSNNIKRTIKNRQFKQNNNQKRKPFNSTSSNENLDKTTLEVRKIPSNLNTIANLNEHFSKFGIITNLKICFDNDTEAALVQYSSNAEALAAYRSTEAVLNNRFIKVFWHNPNNVSEKEKLNSENSDKIDSENTKKTLSIKEHLGISGKQASINNKAVNNLINSGLINSNTPNQLASLMVSTSGSNSKLINKVVSVKTSVSKPVFNPALLKKQYTPATNLQTSSNSNLNSNSVANSSSNTNSTTSTTTNSITNDSNTNSSNGSSIVNLASTITNSVASSNSHPPAKSTTKVNNSNSLAKLQPQLNKEKLMKKLELQKKRQEMLSQSIKQNRILIEKLEKAKTDAERQSIRETVILLTKQIKQLEEDIKKENALIMEETNLQKQSLVI